MMHAKRPKVWAGLMNWLMHADTGQTTSEATRMGAAEPTGLQQREWEDINHYAMAELNAISAYITRFGVIEAIMMRDRRDVLVSGRTGVEEHVLAQETYFILCEYTGGGYEAEQALRRMQIWCQHRLMSASTILDLCLMQTQDGHVAHYRAPEDSGWSLRVRAMINTIRSDFDETKYGHLPAIIYDRKLRYLSVDVTKPSTTPIAHAQAQAAARTVFGFAGTCSLLTAVKKLPGEMRLKMVTPLERIAQVQEAVQAGTLEAEAAPEDTPWCRYCELLVQHILDLSSHGGLFGTEAAQIRPTRLSRNFTKVFGRSPWKKTHGAPPWKERSTACDSSCQRIGLWPTLCEDVSDTLRRGRCRTTGPRTTRGKL
jgi:hypothetical protein